jgi:hypothetical protein
MTTAWTKWIALGALLFPLGCEVRVHDGPADGYGGNSGDYGDGGTGGTDIDLGGSGGTDLGGSGGSDEFPAPTCGEEDVDDECIQCLKQSCCDQWLACDDFGCFDEWTGTAACVTQIDFPSSEQFGECLSSSVTSGEDFPQPNTVDLLDCANAVDEETGSTRCGVACFGSDIFFD